MKKQDLPPTADIGRNLDERPHIALDGLMVTEWTPERDGKGTPEEVHVVFDVGTVSFVMAFKSQRAIDEFIGVLQRHRNSVFGGDGN